MQLSIGMMIKNEEKHLNECLESLRPLLENIESEIIIIDTGSTDNSVNIAKNFTNKVFFHPWNDNFSEMRNKVIDYCTGEWIMIIDGDEVLENPTAIINFIKSKNSKKFNTALLMVKNLTDEKDLSSFSMICSPRLFRNDKDFHYEGAVHNQPKFKAPIAKLESSLLHYGYISTDKELMEKKYKRTVSLLEKELEHDPSNFYYWCQLSVSYSMHNEYEKAEDIGIKAYEILKSSGLNKEEYIYVYMQLAYTYLMNKKYKEARDICLEGIALKSGILDLYFYLAKAQMRTKDYTNAIINYKEYLNVLDNANNLNDTNLSLYTLGKYEYAYYDLVIGFKEIEDYESEFEYSKKITDEKLVELNLPNMIYLCLKNKDYIFLLDYYNKYVVRLKLQGSFEIILESYQKELTYEERFEIVKAFKDIDNIYGALNKVRYSIFENEELSFDINNYLELNVDFNVLSDYYGDFIYYLILHNMDISKHLSKVRELDFNKFFIYLSDRYANFAENISLYLQQMDFEENQFVLRIKKALGRYVITLCQLNDEEFTGIFNQYIEDGTAYINKIYSNDLILNESIYDVKNEEEAFLLYMLKANSVKNSDKKSYIVYLRKALKVYPVMRRGIELLVYGFNDASNKVNDELEQYKTKVKNSIKDFINNNMLEEAQTIISEYEQIIKNDIEIILFKSQISIAASNTKNNCDYKM